jgi:FkbM family methyltransferase
MLTIESRVKGRPCEEICEVRMTQVKAKFWDTVLTIYGKATPAHPGKWRVIDALTSRAEPAWKGKRYATYNGVRFELDLTDYVERHIYLREFDAWETRFLKRYVKPGWVAIDAGANVGYYTLLLSRLVGSLGMVHAFEPDAHNWKRLSRTIDLNGPQNVRAHKLALGDSCGEACIAITPPGSSSKTHLAVEKSEGGEIVEQITLDAFVSRHDLKRLDVVKVDIEGCEERFVDGGSQTLRRFKPLLLIELNPKTLLTFGATTHSLVSKLENIGYRLFTLKWSGLASLKTMPEGEEYINVVGVANS